MDSYLCSRCHGKFPFGEIKYDRQMKLVCLGCLGEAETRPEKERKKPSRESPYVGKDGKKKYICSTCRFNFAVHPKSPATLRCPYCGKTNLLQVKRYKDVNDLIDEAGDTRYDY